MKSEKTFATFQKELLKTYSQRKITKPLSLTYRNNCFSTIDFLCSSIYCNKYLFQ